MKIGRTLANVQRNKAQELVQKQLLNKQIRLENACNKVAKTCGIRKPVNITVNKNTNSSFKDVRLVSDYNEFAAWSPLASAKKNVKFDIKA